MALGSENYAFFVPVGVTILFLLLGTFSGIFMDRRLRNRKGSFVTKTRNKPSSSESQLRLLIRSLEFEKSLTADCLVRVSEALNQGKIDSQEYDRLVVQYNEKLHSYEKKLAELRSTLDYIEIRDLRKDLDYFLQDRMKWLDDKLLQLSRRKMEDLESSPNSSEDTALNGLAQLRGRDRAHRNSRLISPHTQPDADHENRIRQTQMEINAALDRLERVQPAQGQRSGQATNMKKKDALAGLSSPQPDTHP
jgi:hypothetical protein